MGVLFISHASADNAAAIRVREWLTGKGWGQVFLDLDPEQGIVPGHRWQQELKLAGERCSGVVLLISPNWVASRWCQTEFLVADQLGKKIFPVLIAPTNFDEIARELTGRLQFADISTPDKELDGFARLAIGLKRAGLDPQSFTWPPPNEPNRPIYRGLQSLDEADAAIFFGRDALITKGMDAMRRIRQGAPECMLVVLGASGAGKSSFLKAGLVARMKRDEENFLVLPTLRPDRAAITGAQGLAASFGCESARAADPAAAIAALARLRASAAERFHRYAAVGSGAFRPPTIVIPLDQAEELFLPENREAAQAIEVLSHILRLRGDIVLAVTIRSDSFQKLQAEPRLGDLPLLPFSLPPIPLGAFKEVIEGPARLASPPLTVEAALCDRLLQDLAAEDALPLLAFTLERLSARHPHGGSITLREYVEEFGGLEGAIVGAVEAAFQEAMRDPALPHSHVELERLARAAFIPALVHVGDTDAEPRRRVEPLDALPRATQPLVRHLINQRLLVCHKNVVNGSEMDTVEVTHEAILRQWPALRTWVAEERDALRALDALRDAATEWRAHTPSSGEGWLTHRGGRLEEAEALRRRPDFTTALEPTVIEYLAACRSRDDAELLREKEMLKSTQRLQRRIGIVIVAAAVVVLIAGASVLRLFSGMSRQASESLSALASKEAAGLHYDRAERYAAAGLNGVGWGGSAYGSATAAAELEGAAAASSVLAVLRGHTDQVLSAAFSPDGRRIVTASRDNTARIWDAATGRQIGVLRGHSRAVLNAAFSPDGQRIVTASEDKTARIWSENRTDRILVLRGHRQTVYNASFSPDGRHVVTASSDGTARIWDANSGREILVLVGHTDPVESAAFSPDGNRIVTGSDDKTARLWDAQSGKQLTVLNGHTGTVESVAFSSDGKRVVTASDDKTARIWDVARGQSLQVLRGHTEDVRSAAFSKDDNYVVTGSGDKTARLWNAADGRELLRFFHNDGVNSATFSPDLSRMVTASDDRTARIWNMRKGLRVLRGHDGIVTAVAFSPDGQRIATGSVDRTVRLWDVKTGRQIASLPGHHGFVETVAFSPDGTRCVSGSDDGTARIWDAKSGQQLTILRGHGDAVYSAAYSPDGRQIVTASVDGTARIWDAATGHTVAVLKGDRKVISASFNSDGMRVITAFSNGTAAVWDSRNRKRLFMLRGHERAVIGAAFSRNGKWIVTAGQDRTARIWDAQSGQQLAVLSSHLGPVMSAEFSPDSRFVATASQDQTVRLWDRATAQEIAVLHGHDGQVNGLAFSSDGHRLASASEDGTARIWDLSGIAPESPDALLRRVCATSLAHSLSLFSAEELREAQPVLDPAISADACHPPGLWSRLGRIFWAGFSR